MIEQTEIAFSHRPRIGISVGVFVQGETAYMSAAFRNPTDDFNRKLSRQIVTCRLNSRMERDVAFTYALDSEGTDARAIMREFRATFKPDPEETDSLFEAVEDFGGVESREPIQRDQAWGNLQAMFIDAIQSAKSQCVS